MRPVVFAARFRLSHLHAGLFLRTIYVETDTHDNARTGTANSSEEGGNTTYMGWRAKFVLLLIVYSAGFATAVYCLSPAPDLEPGQQADQGRILAKFKSEEFAQSVNSGMHKAIAFGKEAATRTAEMIREKVDEIQSKSDG